MASLKLNVCKIYNWRILLEYFFVCITNYQIGHLNMYEYDLCHYVWQRSTVNKYLNRIFIQENKIIAEYFAIGCEKNNLNDVKMSEGSYL